MKQFSTRLYDTSLGYNYLRALRFFITTTILPEIKNEPIHTLNGDACT